MIKIVESVLIDFNNDIVSSLEKMGSKAVSINTKKNNIIEVVPEAKELGFVGIPKKINQSIIEGIVKEKKVPVIAPLGLDKDNQVFNINADTAAGVNEKKIAQINNWNANQN